MRTPAIPLFLALLAAGCAAPARTSPSGMSAAGATAPATTGDWAMNATIIEACTCPMFCQCYFTTAPATHGPGCCLGGEPGTYCRFNNAFRVNRGHHGSTRLDGARFWVAGDLGGDFSQGNMQWAVLTFDPSVTPPQREAIQNILGHLYPVKWSSFAVGKDAPMEWRATKDRAEARLDGGKIGEVVLARNQGMTDDPIVIHNLRYWGAPRNDGFVLMQNEVEAWRGDKPFEFKRSNGFMITVDIAAADVATAKPK